jgi:antitoxin VapB
MHYIVIYCSLLWYTVGDMALSIKSMEAERLAREIAAKTGESLTDAIRKALEERLDRLRNQRRSQILASQLDEILRRVDQLPVLDSRSPEEILGYDEHGLPR